jgi:hypothetical protein
MRALGVLVWMAGKDDPRARAVVIDGSPGAWAVVAAWDVGTRQAELAGTLAEMAEALASRARGLDVNRALVRRADRGARASNQEGPRTRLLAEGAIAGALRRVVADTYLRDGKACATLLGKDKQTLDDEAEASLTASGQDAKYAEACAAAVAALAV